MLTSTLPWRDGLEATVKQMGSELGSRVMGFTYEDLTTVVTRDVRNHRSGKTRSVGYSSDDYWRMNKSDIVAAHANWLKPRSWIAVDDQEGRQRLVRIRYCMQKQLPTQGVTKEPILSS